RGRSAPTARAKCRRPPAHGARAGALRRASSRRSADTRRARRGRAASPMRKRRARRGGPWRRRGIPARGARGDRRVLRGRDPEDAQRSQQRMERTLILVKPDAFARGLTGEIIARFERKGLKIRALRSMTVERELAERHYAEHAERPFFGELVQFINSGVVVPLLLDGVNTMSSARRV